MGAGSGSSRAVSVTILIADRPRRVVMTPASLDGRSERAESSPTILVRPATMPIRERSLPVTPWPCRFGAARRSACETLFQSRPTDSTFEPTRPKSVENESQIRSHSCRGRIVGAAFGSERAGAGGATARVDRTPGGAGVRDRRPWRADRHGRGGGRGKALPQGIPPERRVAFRGRTGTDDRSARFGHRPGRRDRKPGQRIAPGARAHVRARRAHRNRAR